MIGTPTRQTAWLIGVFISIVLIVLVAIPLFLSNRTGAAIDELNEQADPAERLTGAIQEALSHELAAIMGFQTTGLDRYIQLYRSQKKVIDDAIKQTARFTPRLGPFIQAAAQT
jgi:CHASE3 domain sensor protein